ncbi:DNA lesion error-prone repair protein ImuA, partial [Xanthomonas oryzae pv. oryzae]
MSEPVQLRQHGNAAVAMPLDALLAARTVWRAGQ